MDGYSTRVRCTVDCVCWPADESFSESEQQLFRRLSDALNDSMDFDAVVAILTAFKTAHAPSPRRLAYLLSVPLPRGGSCSVTLLYLALALPLAGRNSGLLDILVSARVCPQGGYSKLQRVADPSKHPGRANAIYSAMHAARAGTAPTFVCAAIESLGMYPWCGCFALDCQRKDAQRHVARWHRWRARPMKRRWVALTAA